MSKNLEKAGKKVHVAEIVHHGEQLILPEGMNIDQCIQLLLQRREYLQQVINIAQEYPRYPLDGAYALYQVLRERYGWAQMRPTKTMFGERPPQMINIEIAPGQYESVPWGEFSLPNIEDGRITCQAANNGTGFALQATVRRKYEDYVRELFAQVKAYLDKYSIYMGQPVKLTFDKDDETAGPDVNFVDVSDADIEKLIYTREIEGAIQTNLFTPIGRVRDCLDNGIPVKRGVLLAGHFGCGKTLAAKAAAKLAKANAVTFIYIDKSSDFSKAIEFAKVYCDPMAVVFCEDIDRAARGQRTEEIDAILNIMDGVDSKNYPIMTVLTTNELDKITPAMQRPGRLDAIIEVLPPDAEAAVRLVRAYGGDLIDADEDLAAVGAKLDGFIPAIIAEVVKRAKLSQLRLLEPGAKIDKISAEALMDAIITIEPQAERLNRKLEDAAPTIDQLISGTVERVVDGKTKRSHKQLKDIHERVCS